MAKDKYELEDKIDQNTISSGCIIYDGDRMDKVTVYTKGQLKSEIKPEHKKHFGL